jgi:3D-(3,5/4)-trihydroxycyclohexane-1,2-dione acylhydrolase (decyclizing)
VPDPKDVEEASAILASASRPLLIAGGGVRYSAAEAELATFAERLGIPVAETVAGKGSLVIDHPNYAGPIGVTGSPSANALAEEADVVLAVGTRLQDFTTGSWALFRDPGFRLVSVNVGRWDATKHRARAVMGDALVSLQQIGEQLGGYRAPPGWLDRAVRLRAEWLRSLDDAVTADLDPPSYAQVIRAVHDVADPTDYVVAAAGGLPGELNANWHVREVGAIDCEYGFSCMGYEIAGAWGAKMAFGDHRDVVSWVGDGSYLMMNSDVYSTVLSGHKVIFIVCSTTFSTNAGWWSRSGSTSWRMPWRWERAPRRSAPRASCRRPIGGRSLRTGAR